MSRLAGVQRPPDLLGTYESQMDMIAQRSGQSAETVLCQIAAEELGVPLASVSKATPDTAVTPFDESITSNRSAFHMGNAVRMAARDAREQILQIAGKQMKTPVKKLTIVEGKVQVTGKPDTAIPLSKVLRGRYGFSRKQNYALIILLSGKSAV